MDKQAEHVRDRLIVRTSLVAIGTNLCLVAFKMAVGLLANSIAIVLDAMNNLSDALSSVITILGTKLAGRPPDKKHPFGYGRMEYLTGILIAGIILFAGVNFAVTSVQKIITPDLPHYSLLTVGIVAVAIVTKLLLGAYTKKMGRKTGSDALVASGTDATFDAVISAGTLVGALVTLTSGYVIDGWIGCVISLVILKAGLELLLDTLSSIVGRRADSQLSQEIKQRLCTVDGILGAYDLVLHNYGHGLSECGCLGLADRSGAPHPEQTGPGSHLGRIPHFPLHRFLCGKHPRQRPPGVGRSDPHRMSGLSPGSLHPCLF